MSWIRECTLVGTQGSRKEQLLKDKFDAFLNHRSPDVLLTEFLPQVRTSVDAFLGFMGIFTKYYLEKLVEAKKLDNKLMGLIIESSIVAHGHLLKWKNPRKLEYSFKLFNKLIRKLNADEIATLTKSKLENSYPPSVEECIGKERQHTRLELDPFTAWSQQILGCRTKHTAIQGSYRYFLRRTKAQRLRIRCPTQHSLEKRYCC